MRHVLAKYALAICTFQPIFIDPASGRKCSLLFSTRTRERYLLGTEISEHLRKGYFSSLPQPLLAALISDGIIVPEDADEITHLLNENTKLDKANKTYLLTLMTSLNCQLGCNYYGQSHAKHNTSASVEDEIYATRGAASCTAPF